MMKIMKIKKNISNCINNFRIIIILDKVFKNCQDMIKFKFEKFENQIDSYNDNEQIDNKKSKKTKIPKIYYDNKWFSFRIRIKDFCDTNIGPFKSLEDAVFCCIIYHF